MDDVFFKKLKQVNISDDIEKTKARIKEIWENADKKNRKDLLTNAGPTIYNAIGKITKLGRITAKMTILLSRHLDVNPLYLIGAANEKTHYSELLLKEFLIRLGYNSLWKEYEKYLIKSDMQNIARDKKENDDMPEPAPAEQEKQDAWEEKDDETKFSEFVANIAAEKESAEAMEPDGAQAVMDLTDEEAMVLMRALFIRARINPEAGKRAEQLKSLLLSN